MINTVERYMIRNLVVAGIAIITCFVLPSATQALTALGVIAGYIIYRVTSQKNIGEKVIMVSFLPTVVCLAGRVLQGILAFAAFGSPAAGAVVGSEAAMNTGLGLGLLSGVISIVLVFVTFIATWVLVLYNVYKYFIKPEREVK